MVGKVGSGWRKRLVVAVHGLEWLNWVLCSVSPLDLVLGTSQKNADRIL